jgi:hypothetical protein
VTSKLYRVAFGILLQEDLRVKTVEDMRKMPVSRCVRTPELYPFLSITGIFKPQPLT